MRLDADYFRKRERWALALALSRRPFTLYETARLLGKRSGDIQKKLRGMYDDGVLSADPEPPDEGTVYKLKAEHVDALEQALENERPPGICLEGQRLIEVTAPDVRSFYDVIKKREFAGIVSWDIELDGSGRRLVALSRAAQRAQAELLATAFEAAGCPSRLGRFGEPRTGVELREGTRGIAIAGEG